MVFSYPFSIKFQDFSSVQPTSGTFDRPSVTTIIFYVVLEERETLFCPTKHLTTLVTPFHMTISSTALPAIPICSESGPRAVVVGYRSWLYRVTCIHKSLRDFLTRLRNNQDRHGRKEHINRWRISPSFFFVLGALAYFQVPPLGGSREEKWRSQ